MSSSRGVPLRREIGVLVVLAIPAALTQALTMLMGVVDTLMVSRLGTEALAAATLGSVWVWGTLIVGMGVLYGMDPIVTQAHGAKDGERLGLSLQRGLVLSVAVSVPIGVAWLFTGPALRLAGQSPELARLAHGYVVVQVPSIVALLAYTALRQYLAGRGIMVPALWVAAIANGVNLLLNWALVFGHLGFEPMGLRGAGIATALSRGFMLVALAGYVLLARLHVGAWVPWSRRAFGARGLGEVLRHGIPVGAQFGLEVWGWHAAALLAGLLGAAELAAHAIVLNLAALTFTIPLGVSMAAATRVGNLLGAGDPAGARRAGWLSIGLGAGVMTISAAGFLIFRHALPLAWEPAPPVLLLAVAILPIAAAFQVFDGTQVVASGVLRGLGDTRPAALFNFVGYYVLGLPLGALLAFHFGLGLAGLWWGLTLGLATVAALLAWRIASRAQAAVAQR